MQYVEFSNTGEIDINAFKLLGASTKRGDSTKIGFFGTGLKYALAVLLREQVPVQIYIGKKKLKVGLVPTKFGDRTVHVVTIDGEKTSLTTDAGIDWQLWFAVREIYSNALDEGGNMDIVEKFNPEAETTKIYVGREQLGEVFKNWTTYFSQSREALYENTSGRILGKEAESKFTVFRKGIRVYQKPSNSLFDYDVENIAINESRVASQSWEAQQRSAELLAKCTSDYVLEQFINTDGILEKEPDFWYYLFDFTASQSSFSEAWYRVLKDKRIVAAELSGFYGVTRNSVVLPKKLVDRLASQFKDRLDIAGTGSEHYRIVPTQDATVFDEPLALFAKIGIEYDKDKIFVGVFKDQDCGGVYDKDMDRIVIAEKYTQPASKYGLTNVLFEEIAHAKSGQGDNTRGFQNYLIGIITSLAGEYGKLKA